MANHKIQFSVIIPTLNEADYLSKALSSLPKSTQSIECIIADGGSTDTTKKIIDSFPQVQWIDCIEKGRAAQMNLGAHHASGEFLIFLHADVQLPSDGFKLIAEALSRDEVIAGGFCLSYPTQHWMLKLCELGSRINHPLMTYGDQVLFMRRSTFQQIKGYQDWPLMEDLEIQFRLRKLGKLSKIKTPVISSDRRFIKYGPTRQQLCNIGLVLLFLCGCSPKKLAHWYAPKI